MAIGSLLRTKGRLALNLGTIPALLLNSITVEILPFNGFLSDSMTFTEGQNMAILFLGSMRDWVHELDPVQENED